MSKVTTMDVEIRFGDCDPAGIVFFPRYHRWMDAASLHFFMECGIPPWHVLETTTGIIGTPLLEHHTRFVKSATYGERLTIATRIEQWSRKTFVQKHTVTRGEDLICESAETRIFCVRDAEDRRRIRAIPVPEDIRSKCE
ncbi:MAG: acyl-CoA thioesterase [Burkholderiales bacterium]|jgi:4-hydroxybenzoyl-CoA thioesterase|nr:acyl-CoA thioesterase [Burkholderiales bacterium]